MSGRISQVWIMLNFKQGLGETSVRLIHSNELRIRQQAAGSNFEGSTRFGRGKLNTAATKDVQKYSATVIPRLDEISEEFARPAWTHCFFSDRVKSPQPLLAIIRGVVQQEKGRRRHVFRDITQVPLTTAPERTKLGRLLLRIVAFTRSELFKLQG